jgi:hypothetical protein
MGHNEILGETMEPVTNTYEAWIGRDAYDRNGDKIGEIEAIYYDDVTAGRNGLPCDC